MKTERRHELQHNVLADWLADTVAKVEPYSRAIWATIIGLLVIAALAIYLVRQRSANQQQEWDLYYGGIDALSQGDVTNLADVAERLGDTPAGLWARLQLADAYLTQAVDNEFRDRASSNIDLDRAIEAYQFVQNKAEQTDLLERATLGLARAYESQFKLAEAKAEYEAVVKNWPVGECAAEAKERLADLNRPSTVAFYDWFARQNPAPALQSEPGIPGQGPLFDPGSLPSGDSPFGGSPFGGAPAGVSPGESSPASVPGEFEPLFPELKMRDATEPSAGASDSDASTGETAPAADQAPPSEPTSTSEPAASGDSSAGSSSDQAGQPAADALPQQSPTSSDDVSPDATSTEPVDAGEPKAQP